MSKPIPNIDLGGTVAVIDESGKDLKWKKLGRCFATAANAEKVLKANGYKSGWLLDDLGEKRFIQAK